MFYICRQLLLTCVIRMVRYIQINLRHLLPSCIPVILTVQTDAACHDKQPSDWKPNDPLGFNLQQKGHCLSVGICLTVGCTKINLASKHYTPFCHDGMLHQSMLKKFCCITDIQGFTSILFTDLFLDQGKQNMRKEEMYEYIHDQIFMNNHTVLQPSILKTYLFSFSPSSKTATGKCI